jgi:hypothetical protein
VCVCVCVCASWDQTKTKPVEVCRVGQNRICMHNRTWPYIRWFPCQKYRVYTKYTRFWLNLWKCALVWAGRGVPAGGRAPGLLCLQDGGLCRELAAPLVELSGGLESSWRGGGSVRAGWCPCACCCWARGLPCGECLLLVCLVCASVCLTWCGCVCWCYVGVGVGVGVGVCVCVFNWWKSDPFDFSKSIDLVVDHPLTSFVFPLPSSVFLL